MTDWACFASSAMPHCDAATAMRHIALAPSRRPAALKPRSVGVLLGRVVCSNGTRYRVSVQGMCGSWTGHCVANPICRTPDLRAAIAQRFAVWYERAVMCTKCSAYDNEGRTVCSHRCIHSQQACTRRLCVNQNHSVGPGLTTNDLFRFRHVDAADVRRVVSKAGLPSKAKLVVTAKQSTRYLQCDTKTEDETEVHP